MGKVYTPQPIGSEVNFKNTINNNFEDIETALNEALTRGGELPNQMKADLDLNSHDLLNVANVILKSSLQEPKDIYDDYTLETGDLYRLLKVHSTAEITLPDTEDFAPGWYCHIQKATPTGSVTFTSLDSIEAVMNSREILEQWGMITPFRTDSAWAVTGNLA